MTDERILSREEGFELVETYTTYYWRVNKFYSLKNKYSLEDMIFEIYAHFLEKGFFEKYDPKVTSKKYYVMRGVMTRLIDELRKYRECLSTETPDENGLTLADKLADKVDVEREVRGKIRRDEILEQIPGETRSKLVGKSPILGEVNFSYRVVAQHLEAGFTAEDIAKMYINPKSGRPITTSRVWQIINELREYCLDNIVLYQ